MTKETIKKLSDIIEKRSRELPSGSYVTKLIKEGKVKIANKLGEESVETITAFLAQEKPEIIEESADLIFHLLILLKASDLSFEDVLKALDERMKND
jgi:phosphoribosyl-ATP pyrophosphohydrolase